MTNRITESSSNYDQLENMSFSELLKNMNREDKSVPLAIEKVIPEIEKLAEVVFQRLRDG
ncbi:MAG: N-acetylmuramic acid 6-phosphate etherase, partial [Flavobacteriales bacterium]|nr:N-acetylmuramic acid 6-phosphate etherase [Flavobacteriales bacterium]